MEIWISWLSSETASCRPQVYSGISTPSGHQAAPYSAGQHILPRSPLIVEPYRTLRSNNEWKSKSHDSQVRWLAVDHFVVLAVYNWKSHTRYCNTLFPAHYHWATKTSNSSSQTFSLLTKMFVPPPCTTHNRTVQHFHLLCNTGGGRTIFVSVFNIRE